MKKRILTICIILVVVNLIPSCNKDDTSSNENSELIGSWKRNVNWGSIDGTETITFSNNSTYSVELERIEDYSGSCSLDPYCDNDYSGEYWFEGDKLYYNHSTLGWTDYFSAWSIEGNKLILDGDIYNKQ